MEVHVPEAFAQRIQWLADEEYGGKQEALAAELGVHASTVSRWARGQALPHAPHRRAVDDLVRAPIGRRQRSGADAVIARLEEAADDAG